MDTWPAFVTAVLARHGVADVALAESHGITPQRFYRRTSREEWDAPSTRVRVHPDSNPSVQRSLLTVCASSRDLAAASREVAAWLHGLRAYPPERASVVGQHATRCRGHEGVHVHRARWLTADEITTVQEVPTLTVPATLVSLLGTPRHAQRARLIDALHRGLATTDEVLALLDRVGPLVGKAVLREDCLDLAHRRIESIFHDEVLEELERLEYRPERSTRTIATPDGIDIAGDIALESWRILVEPEGDSYHRGREQRRKDRRRTAAAAGTGWVLFPVDWRDWHLDREHVLAALDAAIAAQQRRGIGADVPAPRRAPERRNATGPTSLTGQSGDGPVVRRPRPRPR